MWIVHIHGLSRWKPQGFKMGYCSDHNPWLMTRLLKTSFNASIQLFTVCALLQRLAYYACLIYLHHSVDRRRMKESVTYNVQIFCFMKNIWLIIIFALIAHWTPTVKSSSGTSLIAWEFSVLHYMLLWLFTYLHKVTHASSEYSVTSGSRSLLNTDS
jgi:hypothetical protein